MSTTYTRAHDVESVVDELIPQHHDHLDRSDVTIRCVFRDPPVRSRGQVVLGKARKIGGLNAHLALGLDHADLPADEPADFFVIEVAFEPWQLMTGAQRLALIDHELSHFDVEDPETEEAERKLLMVGHDLEEFTAVVRRHGLWREAVAELVAAAAASAQPAPPLGDEQGEG